MGIGHSGRSRYHRNFTGIPHPATGPLYLVWFVLDTTGFAHHNPASSMYSLLRPRGDCQIAWRDHWGKQHAILAGLDGAVHQPGLFSARALAARVSVWSKRRFGILP